jgi:hypothetical protein
MKELIAKLKAAKKSLSECRGALSKALLEAGTTEKQDDEVEKLIEDCCSLADGLDDVWN